MHLQMASSLKSPQSSCNTQSNMASPSANKSKQSDIPTSRILQKRLQIPRPGHAVVAGVMTRGSAVQTSKLFEDKADLYASSRPMYPKELFDFISSLVASKGEAWDCAAGNGQASIGLAKIFSKVESTDISKEQISNSFPIENVNYSVQPGESTKFKDNQFDLVNVAQALHWFDYSKFWNEVKRVLKPKGVFIAYSYVWPNVNDDIDRVLEEKIKAIIEPYWASNNKLVWDGYKAIDFPFPLMDVPKVDIKNNWNLDQFLNYIHTWSGTRRCMDNIGTDFFESAKDEMLRSWGDPKQKKMVKNQLIIIAGSAWS